MKCGILDFVESRDDGTFLREVIVVDDLALDTIKKEIRQVWDSINRLEFECLNKDGYCDHCVNVLI